MLLVGAAGQFVRHPLYDASGSVTGGAATGTLVLPEHRSRSYFLFQNLSPFPMRLEFGAARATATLTSNAVSSCSITNRGFGYTNAPIIEFLGGGNAASMAGAANSTFVGVGGPTYPAPSKPAQATATVAGGVVTAITIGEPGASYVVAPFVFITNRLTDPKGCADPAVGGGSGIQLLPGSPPLIFDGTFCPTDPVAAWGEDLGGSTQSFICRYYQ